MYWRHRNPNTTISVGDATFSVAKLKVPGIEIEATTLVGEMLLPSDVPGTAERRLVAIGTAVEWAGVEVASPPHRRTFDTWCSIGPRCEPLVGAGDKVVVRRRGGGSDNHPSS